MPSNSSIFLDPEISKFPATHSGTKRTKMAAAPRAFFHKHRDCTWFTIKSLVLLLFALLVLLFSSSRTIATNGDRNSLPAQDAMEQTSPLATIVQTSSSSLATMEQTPSSLPTMEQALSLSTMEQTSPSHATMEQALSPPSSRPLTAIMFQFMNESSSASTNMQQQEHNHTHEDGCSLPLFSGNLTMDQSCQIVRTNPACRNIFLHFLYCGLQQRALAPLFFVITAIAALLMFFLIGSTIEEYFGPALLVIADYLKMAPNVAGVTLLAFGNCVPEITAIVISVVKANEGVGFGALAGGNLYITTFVFAMVILLATVQVPRRPYLRDSIFYLVSVILVFTAYIRGKVYIWESLFFFVFYAVYVVTVIFGSFLNSALKQYYSTSSLARLIGDVEEVETGNRGPEDERETAHLIKEITSEKEHQYLSSTQQSEILAKENKIRSKSYFVPALGIVSKAKLVFSDGISNNEYESTTNIPSDEHKTDEEQSVLVVHKFEEEDRIVDEIQGNFHVVPLLDEYHVIEKSEIELLSDDQVLSEHTHSTSKLKYCWWAFWHDLGWYEKHNWFRKIVFILIEVYCNFLRNLTIPRANPAHWNKWYTALVPIFSPYLVLLALGFSIGNYSILFYMIGGVFPLALIPLPFGTVLCILVVCTAQRNSQPRYFPLFVLYAFFMSIFWIILCASQLVAIVEALGSVLKVDSSALAVSVLSWGNCTGDLLADISVARNGFPSMAVAAIFASPLMTLLLGTAISMTGKILLLPPVPNAVRYYCTVITKEAPVTVAFIFLIISVTLSVLLVPILKFRPRKLQGLFLAAWYILGVGFVILSIFSDRFAHWIITDFIPGSSNCNRFF